MILHRIIDRWLVKFKKGSIIEIKVDDTDNFIKCKIVSDPYIEKSNSRIFPCVWFINVTIYDKSVPEQRFAIMYQNIYRKYVILENYYKF